MAKVDRTQQIMKMESECNFPGVEFRKGCPACEHSDPELERELKMFAELLLDIYEDARQRKADGDKEKRL
jgi:hypothetical protein